MSRYIILHSFGRTSQDNWYQSIGRSLLETSTEIETITVQIPDLPFSDTAPMEEWLRALYELQPNEDTILIGHSLSGTLILRYLEQAVQPVQATYLVAAPINDLGRPDLQRTGFFTTDFDWPKIRAMAGKCLIIASRDDPTVPFWQAEQLAAELAAPLHALESKGHFKDSTFPELINAIKEQNA